MVLLVRDPGVYTRSRRYIIVRAAGTSDPDGDGISDHIDVVRTHRSPLDLCDREKVALITVRAAVVPVFEQIASSFESQK